MTSQREAKSIGFDTGYGIAQISWPPRGGLTKRMIEKFIENCYEAEDNGRQMSPFEFTAADFNSSRYPDEVWSAYEDGVGKGINAYIRQALRAAKKPKAKTGEKKR